MGMGRFGMVIAGALVLAAPLAAQGITVKSKDGTVESHGEATKADPGNTVGKGPTRGNGEGLKNFVKEIEKTRNVSFADGDLTQDEINALEAKAREKLEKDMAKLGERERENQWEGDAGDRAEEAVDIKKDRYRASMRALERDLLCQVDQLRGPGGDDYEGTFDDVEENIKDTFADLHDQVDEGSPETWQKTLDTARKFHGEYSTQISKWAEKIGVSAEVPNAQESIEEMQDALLDRVKRLRKLGGDKYEEPLDSIEDRVHETFENLLEKLDDSEPKGWTGILTEAEKFMLNYTAELDGWARKIGGDDTLPNAFEQLAALKADLKQQIKDLRRIGGDDYEDVIDEIIERVDDVFADLKDELEDGSNETHADTLEVAAKFHKQFSDTIDAWERKIVGSDKVDRTPVEPTPDTGPRPDYPEKDVELDKGEQMDIVDGVRVARLMPMPKKQLGLKNGLSVNEITDADGALARAGVDVYDIIIKVNGEEIDSRGGLRDAMDKVEKGVEYEILILRDGEENTLKAKR
jgi:hypothetical protein